MEDEKYLQKHLSEISLIIEREYKSMQDVGILGGISGCALFQFYYAKFLDSDYHSNLGIDIVAYCIDKINDGYSFPSYCSGIAGLGWAIQHLQNEGFVELDSDDLLSQFDGFLFERMKFDLMQHDLDFLHGAIGYGYFFLKRFLSTKSDNLKVRYQDYLKELVNELNVQAISESNKLKWEYILDKKTKEKGYNFSLAHGMSSIINFLSRLVQFENFNEISKELIYGSVNYILEFENTNNSFYFPYVVENKKPIETNGRVAWCYGDLGVGLSLLKASKALNNSFIKNKALKILQNTAKIKEPDRTKVIDAGICHGSFGNARIFQNLYKNNPELEFKDAHLFWMKDGQAKANHNDGYAGYKHWNGLENKWINNLSILVGISGIGLTIIDYLSKDFNTWDECLMIS
ncbi:lanthionine synthetase C family protein [Maribacter flavus]|uniref:Lanthionine synthetase C family protein n=1 Tax=Maribacter flavus TaxID=1658664 RepID=A0A5B2TWM7_9FLAO|nr:lanthionine synthetase C family protein [Maribacter flavus]KAA2218523.1 lanthionine synthetase C family protein [Maribacter flavus]